MQSIYFAPLEGITDAIYRRTHAAHFGGVAKYFIPFISPTQNLCFTARELANIAPQENAGLIAVPQILTRDAEHFLWSARALFDLGYGEVNLNLGCPSGTVTAKGKGAGQLCDLPALERFFDAVFAGLPYPMKLSVKTRIGFRSPDEFPALLALFSRYPLCELTVHPRTRGEFYRGTPHRDAYAAALTKTRLPLVYNGDLFTEDDCRTLMGACPGTRALMLGRGLIANPALAQALCGGKPLTRDALRAFTDDLLDAWLSKHPPNVAIARMAEVMKHTACCFEDADKPRKLIRKAKTLAAYREAKAMLFDRELRAVPGFIPEP